MSFKPKHFYWLILISSLLFASCGSHKEATSSSKEEHHSEKSASGSKKIAGKYAELVGVSAKDINENIQLYSFIDDWYGTPYKYGGKSKNGIDCSNFTCTLYKEVYNKPISGTSSSLYDQCRSVSKNDLKEGDLVFFKIEKNSISHIGVYLQNNKFVHATTKKGVMIDDLDEAYYKKYFYKAGRIKD